MKVLVNAVSAKTGGAKTVVESFCSAASFRKDVSFYVVAGFSRPIVAGDNIEWVEIKKSGFSAAFFSLFSVVFLYLKVGASCLLSFNNINSVFLPSSKKFTYFHQAKALDCRNNEKKSVVYRVYMRLFNDVFLVQTKNVYELMLQNGVSENRIKIVWPGVYCNGDDDGGVTVVNQGVFVPICDVDSAHKNFEMVRRVALACGQDVKFITTSFSSKDNEPKNIDFVGPVNREDMSELYRRSTCLFFPSLTETVGLPIFEALSFGLPVVALDRGYINSLKSLFGIESGLVLVRSVDDAVNAIHNIIDARPDVVSIRDFKESGWNEAIKELF